jgi:hypothetical protein
METREMKSKRNYALEYARRIARAVAKGLSRSQGRNHPKASEVAVSARRPAKPIEDDRLKVALKSLRQEKSLTAAAREVKVSPERLRRYATEKNVIERRGRRWVAAAHAALFRRPSAPGRRRRLRLGVQGRPLHVAVSAFLRTNNPAGLREFEGMSVADISGKTHVFETRPNALYRLASAHDQSFEQIYRIVI